MLLLGMPVIALAQDGGDACVKAPISPRTSIDFPTVGMAVEGRDCPQGGNDFLH